MPEDIIDLATTPQTVTRAERAQATVRQLAQLTAQTAGIIINHYNQMMALFWDNPHKLRPEEVAAELGTRAASLFSRATAAKAFIVAHAPQFAGQLAAVPDDYEFAVNQDGSVTITRKAE